MRKYIKKIIKQYITCKHEKFTVIREIYSGVIKYDNAIYFDRRKCNMCGREYYSKYFYWINRKRIYLDKHEKF